MGERRPNASEREPRPLYGPLVAFDGTFAVRSAPTPHDLWSPSELAEYLGVPVATLYRWRYQGEGPPSHKVGRHLRYHSDDVEQWLETRRSPTRSSDSS